MSFPNKYYTTNCSHRTILTEWELCSLDRKVTSREPPRGGWRGTSCFTSIGLTGLPTSVRRESTLGETLKGNDFCRWNGVLVRRKNPVVCILRFVVAPISGRENKSNPLRDHGKVNLSRTTPPSHTDDSRTLSHFRKVKEETGQEEQGSNGFYTSRVFVGVM